MAFNFDKLRTSIDWSIRQLEAPRRNRVESIKQYVGAHYSDSGSDKVVPTNFLELAITIYTRQLAARAPRAIITAKNPDLKPFAKNMEIALNQIPDDIGLGETLHDAVMEAMFSFGVVKVGMCSSGKEVLGKVYGEAFADLVSIDDYFCDMSAKSRNGMQFEGNDYWLDIETARDMFGKKELTPDEETVTGDQGEQRAESVGANEGADVYRDRVWLRDVWLPRERQLVTYGVKSLKLLHTVNWDGPEHGPYHVLGFSHVPGNLLPLPPIALWQDLHELGNNLFRKLGRQADAKKTVAAFAGGNPDDIEALKRAGDGEGMRYNGQKPEMLALGGVDATTLAFYLQVRDLFSYFAGNIDSLGGLAPMTDTVGQDKMLGEAAGTRLKYMAERTVEFARGIFKSLAWYEWTDPVRKRTIEKPLKGTNIKIKSVWSADTRQGRFLDYNLDIDVYSMQDDSPTTKLQKIGLTLERYVFPMMPVMEQQGARLDFRSLIDILSRLTNVPELMDIVQFDEPLPPDPVRGNPNPEKTSMPANTHRTYERVNRPGATRHGKDDVMTRLLMGGGVQQSERVAAGRMTG